MTMITLGDVLRKVLSPKAIGIDDCGCETCTRIKVATIPEDQRNADTAPGWSIPYQPWKCGRCGYQGTPHVRHCRDCDHEKGPAQNITTCSPTECIPKTVCPVCTERDPYALLRAVQDAMRSYEEPAAVSGISVKVGESAGGRGGTLITIGPESAAQFIDTPDRWKDSTFTLSLYVPSSQRTVMFCGVFSDVAHISEGKRAHGSGKLLKAKVDGVEPGIRMKTEHGLIYRAIREDVWTAYREKLCASVHPCDTHDPDSCVCQGACSCHWVKL